MSLASSELVLYIDNTPRLLTQKAEIQKRYAIKKRRGTYDKTAAVRSFKTLANAAARSYVRQYKPGEAWNRAFTSADRDEAARDFEQQFCTAYRLHIFEPMMPERLRRTSGLVRSNPRRKKAKRRGAPPRRRRRRQRRCPVGTKVQTLIFDKDVFSERQAKEWARAHDYRVSKLDETGDSYRMRQLKAARFRPGSFRTISFGEVKAVIGCPR